MRQTSEEYPADLLPDFPDDLTAREGEEGGWRAAAQGGGVAREGEMAGLEDEQGAELVSDAALLSGVSAAADSSAASAAAANLAPSLVVTSPSHLRSGSISRHLYLDEELMASEDASAAAAVDEADGGAAAPSSEVAEGEGPARPRPALRLPVSGEGLGEEPSVTSSHSSESSGGLSSPAHAERRVDVSDAVKLSSILSRHERVLENRFLKDFVPLPPPHASVDTLVATSLAQFSKPIVQVLREQLPYLRYQPRSIRLLDYEADEQVKAKARLDQAKAQLSSAADGGAADGGKRSTQRLQDLFTANGNDAAAASTSTAAASSSSSLSDPAFLDLDDGRYEQLGGADELVDAALFSVSDDDVSACIKREQAASTREGLFWRYSPQFEWSEQQSAELLLVKRQPVAFWTSAAHHARHFLLSVQSLRFGLGCVEPLFCTLALYDLRAEAKCSEDFHFDLNDQSLLTGQAQVEHSLADPLTTCKHALFSLTDQHVHEQLVLVLKVERVLQGDPADMEVYLKSKLRTPAELQAMAKKSRANLVHLSDFRQPFAWGLLPLFGAQGELRTGQHGSVRMERLYMQAESLKEDLFLALAKETLQDGGKKLRLFPASFFDCRLDSLDERCMPANRVDPSCIPLKNTATIAPAQHLAELNVATDHTAATSTATASPSTSSTSSAASSSVPVVREVLDFTTSTLPIPANGFVNLLYVYPESIRFDRFRNIACRVQLRQSDSHVDPTGTHASQHAAPSSSSSGASSSAPPPSLSPTGAEVLKVILGKSSSSSFTTSAMTQVNYHKKAVTPQDEVKVMLPLHLTPTFHLFFTFYKVSCTTRPGQKEIIGYAVLPLYTRHRLLSDDVYALPIAAKLPRGYLLPYSEGRDVDSIHFRMNGAKVFSVRIRVQSSIFNTDDAVNHFIQTFPNVRELQAIGADKGRDLCVKAVEAIPKADPLLAIRFLPSILDHLMDLLMSRSASFQSQFFAFQALTLYIHRISGYFDDSHRCPLLVSYITFRLSNHTTHEHTQQQHASHTAAPASSSSSFSPTGGPTAGHPPLYAVLGKVWLAGLSSKDASPNMAHQPLHAPLVRAANDGEGRSAAGGSGPSLSPSLSSPSSPDRLCLVYAWFYLECLAKSMALERCELGRLVSGHRDDFLLHFSALVDVFVQVVRTHRSIGLTVVRQLVVALAAFLLDLFAVVEKDAVLDLIERFLVPLRNVGHDPNLLELKFIAHTILADYNLYWDVAELQELDTAAVQRAAKTALEAAKSQHAGDSQPFGTAEQEEQRSEASSNDGVEGDARLVAAVESGSTSSTALLRGGARGSGVPMRASAEGGDYRLLVREELLARLRSSYRLCALLIDDVVHHLSCKEAVLRDQVIDCLRLFLTKTDYDQRWRSAKPLIATALFPLIPALCGEVEVIAALEPRTRRNVLAPFLWVLHQVPSSILVLHWQCGEAEEQRGLLALLNLALDDFAYVGIRTREAEASGSESSYTLAPESADALLNHSMSASTRSAGEGGVGVAAGGGMAGSASTARKLHIEQHMDLVHKTRAFGGSRSRLAAAAAGLGGGVGAAGGATSAGSLGSFGAAAGGTGAGLSTGSGGAAPVRRGGDAAQYNTISGYPSASVVVGPAPAVGSQLSAGPLALAAPSLPALQPPTTLSSATSTPSAGRVSHPPPLSSASSPAILALSSSAVSAGVAVPSSTASAVAVPGSALGGGSVSGGAVSSPATAGSLRRLRASMVANSAAGSRSYSASTLRGYGRTVSGGSSQSLSSLHREQVMAVVRYEGALTRLVSRIALSTLSRYLRVFAQTLAQSGDAFLESLRLLTGLLSHPQPNSFLLTVFPVVLAFVRRFGTALQSSPARQVEYARLTNSVFRTASASSKAVRRHAVAVVYQALMNDFLIKHQLTQLQTQFTMELSRLTEGLAAINERCLQQSFSSLALLGERYGLQPDVACIDPELVFHAADEAREGELSSSASAGEFRLCLQTLLSRLSTILGDSMEISRQSKLGDDADSAITEALLCQVADAFSHLPEVRIEWLKRLAKHHQQHRAFAEAGQCYLLVAQLAAERKKERLRVADEGGEGLAVDELEAVDRVICSYYEACVSQLAEAELYEQCSDVYAALLPYYAQWHDYARLSKSHLHLHSVFEKLLEANSKQTRMLGTYYRVGFYGHRFGARLDGREFIYKQPKITRLMEIATHMKQLYSKQLGTAVRILPDSNPVDRTKLDPEECVLQVTFVSPYFGSAGDGLAMHAHSGEADDADGGDADVHHTNDVARGFHESTTNPSSVALGLRPTLLTYVGLRPRSLWIEQASFLTAFKFSTPFTAAGKAFGLVTEQQKRNTVLHVQHPFPAILTAQLVVRKTETILTAIESATEDVNARTASIVEHIDSPHLNARAITQIIQGSVATQVHGGAKEICQAFLKPPANTAQHADAEDDAASPSSSSTSSSSSSSSSTAWSAEARSNLRLALLSFLDACSRALEVNSRLCATDADREWQDNMDRLYEAMLDDMQPYLSQHTQAQPQHAEGAAEGAGREGEQQRGAGAGSRSGGDARVRVQDSTAEVGAGVIGASASSRRALPALRKSARGGQGRPASAAAGPAPVSSLSVSFK